MPNDLEAFLVTHGEAIGRAISIVCRRARLNDSDCQELTQEVWLHLLRNNGTAIRRFEGRSAPDTFFVRIVMNVLGGVRRRREGRWRPSATARRLGPVARELESLIERDGFTPHEAVETVHARRGNARNDLESLIEQLQPLRRSRAFRIAALLEEIDSHADVRTSTSPEHERNDLEPNCESERIVNLIQRAWALLTEQQRLTLAEQVADARPHRTRRDFLQASAELQDLLASAGVGWAEVSAALKEPGIDVGLRQILEHPCGSSDLDAARHGLGEERRGEERRGENAVLSSASDEPRLEQALMSGDPLPAGSVRSRTRTATRMALLVSSASERSSCLPGFTASQLPSFRA